MDINCRKLDCVHNKKCVCTAKNIDIDNASICKSYVLDKDKRVEDISKNLFSKTPEYENFRHIKNANIYCQNHCIFNKCNKCLANGIIIIEDKKNAKCGTTISIDCTKRENKQKK